MESSSLELKPPSLRVTLERTSDPPASPSNNSRLRILSEDVSNRALVCADGVIPDQIPPRPSGHHNNNNHTTTRTSASSIQIASPVGDDNDKNRISASELQQQTASSKLSRKTILKITFITVFVCTAFALQFIPAVSKALVTALYWFYDHEVAGVVLLWIIYCVGSVFMIPGKTLLAIGVGYLYGFFGGFALLATSSLLASNISFGIGYMYRDSVLRIGKRLFLKKWSESKWNALIRLLQTEGFKTCIAIRSTPIPKEISVPIFGATAIHYKDFLASAIIHLFLSNMILSLYAGSTAKSIQDVANGTATESTKVNLGLTLALLLVALILGFWIAKRGKRYFDEAESIVEKRESTLTANNNKHGGHTAGAHDRGESSTNPLSGSSIATELPSNQSSAIVKGSEASDEHHI